MSALPLSMLYAASSATYAGLIRHTEREQGEYYFLESNVRIDDREMRRLRVFPAVLVRKMLQLEDGCPQLLRDAAADNECSFVRELKAGGYSMAEIIHAENDNERYGLIAGSTAWQDERTLKPPSRWDIGLFYYQSGLIMVGAPMLLWLICHGAVTLGESKEIRLEIERKWAELWAEFDGADDIDLVPDQVIKTMLVWKWLQNRFAGKFLAELLESKRLLLKGQKTYLSLRLHEMTDDEVRFSGIESLPMEDASMTGVEIANLYRVRGAIRKLSGPKLSIKWQGFVNELISQDISLENTKSMRQIAHLVDVCRRAA